MESTKVNNAIDEAFAASRKRGEALFMPFLTVGDPEPAATIEILKVLEECGAGMVELGVPYSDPLADGPVIQRASERALRHRITIRQCIAIAKEAREAGVTIPFILFSYYNPVLQTGIELVMQEAAEAGISGLIIPDLPHEEDGPAREACAKHGLHLIPLVAPTSEQRIQRIVSKASGFIYCVSSLGVTGMRAQFHDGIDQFLNTVKQAASLPIAIGFGISNAEQFKRFSGICDGIVVGSAIVHQIEKSAPLLDSVAERERGLEQIREFVLQLRGQ
ncbi:tryptophan synthase subunit alpha [Xylanibacillus composti]|uniref:Tryptophan synthase alpha chain n=1 Tax=Xylanibacillus composti TaxID=1572762 RepID=A0A8J4M1I6_9BACL|nr:tryptophan synthase subunit alpha [Xylanibacillus composti]MDT9725473.1 tryptophan synthase subunit alpha [Xylanibacillus composti]GIQ67566.1 tryptophan synthase alpha chain [Xylanibacillus composti]